MLTIFIMLILYIYKIHDEKNLMLAFIDDIKLQNYDFKLRSIRRESIFGN